MLGLGGEGAESVAIGDELEALVDALSHRLLGLRDVPLHFLDQVAPLLVLLLQGEELPLEGVSLVGRVLQLLPQVVETLLQLVQLEGQLLAQLELPVHGLRLRGAWPVLGVRCGIPPSLL